MEAIIQEIEVEKLLPIFDIPKEIWNSRVEVTIKPIEKKNRDTTAEPQPSPKGVEPEVRGSPLERIRQYREKYNRDVFIDRLKEQADKGHSFGFDVQKVIDGTETEEETQARYRLEKQTWSNETGRKV
jgi:hypothetical protein